MCATQVKLNLKNLRLFTSVAEKSITVFIVGILAWRPPGHDADLETAATVATDQAVTNGFHPNYLVLNVPKKVNAHRDIIWWIW